MPNILLNLAAAGIVALVIHESGHYVAALCFGRRLKFRFEWGKLFGVMPVPRWVWGMPYMDEWKQTFVAIAGFTAELTAAMVAAALGWLWLLPVASVHIIAYPFYAGDASDFKWL